MFKSFSKSVLIEKSYAYRYMDYPVIVFYDVSEHLVAGIYGYETSRKNLMRDNPSEYIFSGTFTPEVESLLVWRI